jgi:hypothetical protein
MTRPTGPEVPQEGRGTVLFPQKSSVKPQKPHLEQHTFRGQVSTSAYPGAPYPGSQYDLLSQPATQTSGAQSIGTC